MKSGTGWAVAVASLAIWVLAPVSWTQAVHDGGILSVLHEPQTARAEDVGTGDDPLTWPLGSGAGGITITTCDSSPTPVAVTPIAPSENAAPATPSATQSGQQQTFRLCGGSDPATEQAIEQLVAGRNYRATLVSRSDGCADLTIAVLPGSGPGVSGQQSTNLSVGSGSGGTISARIVSANGATHVTIGSNVSSG